MTRLPPEQARSTREHPAQGADVAQLYLDLLKGVLVRVVVGEQYRPWIQAGGGRALRRAVAGFFDRRGLEVVRKAPGDPALRAEGRTWPAEAETMSGLAQLENAQSCIEDVLARGVPGDLIECGVWRGGVAILMRAVLKAYGAKDRRVWLADSFRGLPPPDASRYPQDAGMALHLFPYLAVPVDEVKANFERYGLLDTQVRFLEGWFADTLPHAPIERLAVLRLDADLYESTMQALVALYPKVSVGGWVIVDDYQAIPACRAAVEDYRREQGISDPLEKVDWKAVCWQKQS